jgi:hypothetical protein
VKGGLGSPLAGFSPNTEISFLMISPYLLDFCPVFLLLFSPLETADFLMLFKPLGFGYSLLCSQKTASAAHSCTRSFNFKKCSFRRLLWVQIFLRHFT